MFSVAPFHFKWKLNGEKIPNTAYRHFHLGQVQQICIFEQQSQLSVPVENGRSCGTLNYNNTYRKQECSWKAFELRRHMLPFCYVILMNLFLQILFMFQGIESFKFVSIFPFLLFSLPFAVLFYSFVPRCN